MSTLDAQQIAQNLSEVRAQIEQACERVGREPSEVTLVAVSKKKPATNILAVAEAGLQHFGENRVEESIEKIPTVVESCNTPLMWHMIGHVQSRKVRDVVQLFDVVESIDSLKLAEKFSRQLEVYPDRQLDLLMQVNVSGEDAKSGFEAYQWKDHKDILESFKSDFQHLVSLPNLRIKGFMTMAPFYADAEQTRPTFKALAELRDVISEEFEMDLPVLSMGMTNDFMVAIEEGATLVRIGRAIFGERE